MAVILSNPSVVTPGPLLEELNQLLGRLLQEVDVRVRLPKAVLEFAEFVGLIEEAELKEGGDDVEVLLGILFLYYIVKVELSLFVDVAQ